MIKQTKHRFFSKEQLAVTALSLLIGFNAIAQETEKPMEEYKPVTQSKEYKGLIFDFNKNWSLKFGGNLNAFFTHSSIKDAEGKDDGSVQSISNGLLPANLGISPMFTSDKGVKVVGTFGLWFGVPSNGLNNDKTNTALSQSTVDIRQLFVDVSGKFGGFGFGRNFGLFGLDAILGDISLLGVGASYSFLNPAHTSLGGIGYGYIYCDRLQQINYTTPTLGGTTLTLGAYDALKSSSSSDERSLGVQAKLATAQKFGDNFGLNASVAFLMQGRPEIKSGAKTINGVDVFLKLNIIKALNITGYLYTGSGIGDVGFLLGGLKTDKDGKTAAAVSFGYYAQASYTLGKKAPMTFGINYGNSSLETNKVTDPKSGETETQNSTRITGSYAINVLPNLILRLEYTSQSKQTILGKGNEAGIIALGATFVF